MGRRRKSKGDGGESTAIVKASVFDGDRGESNLAPINEDSQFFKQRNALTPPYEPRSLAGMFDRSHALRPNVDVYTVNIEGFGHRFEPAIDLEDEKADELIRASLQVEAVFDAPQGKAPPVITDEMVAARRAEIEGVMLLEKLQLELFFAHPAGDVSFVELRERTRLDLEVTGNGYWEVVRDGRGQISMMVHAPSIDMRLKPLEPEQCEVDVPRRISAVSFREITIRRRFRTYVQRVNGQEVRFFKELGDPRLMSSTSGRFYKSEKEAKKAEPSFVPATEMIHFRIYSPLSVYGVPRWVGATPAVIGTRAAEEVNLLYFDNKAVPPLAILVSGGTLARGATQRIKNYLRDHIKGRENFHSVLVLEASGTPAMAGSTPPRVRIELKPLTDAQQQDALFMEYDERNTEKVGGMFRLPRLLRGDVRDFNRSTADAALRYAEQQVFQPERVKVDHMINNRLFADMGIRFWRFVSNSPIAKDPAEQAKMLQELESYLTPEEAREIAGPLFGKDLKKIDQAWVKFPPKLFLAMLQQGVGLPSDLGGTGQGMPSEGDLVERLLGMRERLERRAGERAHYELDEATKAEGKADQVTLHVPAAEFAKWVVHDDAAAE